ncbi:MAG: PilZ domain-containing protein [Erythrobacter sp.]|uniref:PilZ domain-containing protein n=1 Tax=Erythrobacter sp. TaxID=1042 RepID=UPI003C71D21D
MTALVQKLHATISRERRGANRRTVHLSMSVEGSPEEAMATIHDMSETGLRLETACKIDPEETLIVELPFLGVTEAKVIWSDGNFHGCEFLSPMSKGAVSAAILRSRPYPSERRNAAPIEEIPVGTDPSIEDLIAWEAGFQKTKGVAGYQLLGFRKAEEGVLIAMVGKNH